MKKIVTLIDMINDELDGAEEYAKCALRYETEDKALSDLFVSLANQELSHYNSLHDQVVKAIKAEQSAGRDVPTGMMAVWEWEHDKMADRVSRIRSILSR